MVALSIETAIHDELAEKRYALVPADAITPLETYGYAWDVLAAEYPYLPPDNYLPGGGRYRFRRYDRFVFDPKADILELMPHEDYFQGTDINAVTGGIVRKFASLTPEIAENPFLRALIRWDFAQFPMHEPGWQEGMWQVDVHMIHVISKQGEVGHPTPEGVHRDGAEFVTVHLAALDNADGGVVTVYDDEKQPLESFQLDHIMNSYLFEDAKLWHGVTPIIPDDPSRPAQRGILTFDYHFLG